MTTSIAPVIVGLASLLHGPEIKGDATLFQVLRDAQAANIARFPRGRLSATAIHRQSNHVLPTEEYHVDVAWLDALGRWEFDHAEPSTAADYTKQTGKPFGIRPGRLVFDGKEFCLHYPQSTTPVGSAVVFAPDDWEKAFATLPYIDFRPSVFWRSIHGRPWDELIGPHPNFDKSAMKMSREWAVQRAGSFVTIERHDGPAGPFPNGATLPPGKSTIVCSMDHGGHPVVMSYEPQFSRLEMEWSKDAEGRTYLKRLHERRDSGRGIMLEREVTITNRLVSEVP
jgi:hypothetical protein